MADSGRDGVEVKLTIEEPLMQTEQVKRMADIPIEVCINEEQMTAKKKVDSPHNDSESVIENDFRDRQAPDITRQLDSEKQSNEKAGRYPNRPRRKATCKGGKNLRRRLKARRRKKTRALNKKCCSMRQKMTSVFNQGHSEWYRKSADVGARRKQKESTQA